MKKPVAHTLTALALAMAAAFPAQAVLERAGPIDNSPSVGGFPAWFQDKTGLALEFCAPDAAELAGGWCLLLPGDANVPESFPTNFFDEHFYFAANALVSAGTVKASLVLALESAFANNVAPGDQMVFGRIRVTVGPVPAAGTYTVYHPYGKWVIPDVAAGERIFVTEDIGVACVATFQCALNSNVGPFLLPSPVPGGAEVPPIPDLVAGQDPAYDAMLAAGGTTPYPGNGRKYIADPGRIGPVTGSPLAPFVASDGVTYNHNTFRVEGPGGLAMQTNDFSLMGRVMTGSMPGKVTADRASYSRPVAGSTTGMKLDVFATGLATTVGRVPAQPTPQAITPILTFFDVPCGGTVDANGQLQPPYTHPVGGNEVQMVNTGSRYWGQTQPAAIPTAVCLEDSAARDAAGQVVPNFYNVKVTDEVTVTSASYDAANGGTLTVRATSSDASVPGPVLSVAGYGDMAGGALTVTPLLAPPQRVSVLSSEGGTAELLVSTAVGAHNGVGLPLAVTDEVSMFEDCSATASLSCAAGSSLLIAPLANDVYNNAPIGAGAVVNIVVLPRFGTMVLNADNTITYTPNANANGMEGIGYTVTVDGKTSAAAYISIAVTAVNDLPVAANDALDAVMGFANSANPMANDSDVDGATDLANIQILTWPAELGPQPVPANGVVSFTPSAAGTFAFTYNVVDAAGAASAAPATATVTVQGSETITFVGGATYRRDQTRWQIDGTDSIRAGQTLTIAFNNGTLSAAEGGGTCDGTATIAKCLVATATVDALGNWTVDQRGATGAKNPTSASWAVRPTAVRAFSSAPVLGGSQTSSITIK